MPRIVIDGFPLCVRSAGVATYTAELLTALTSQAPDDGIEVFCPALMPNRHAGVRRIDRLPDSLQITNSIAYPLVMEHPYPALSGLLSLEAVIGAIDVFHATAYALPRRRRCPVVCTIHDLALLRFPELGTARMRSLVKRTARSLHEVDLIIAVSMTTKSDLVELCGVEESRIRVIHNGVSARFKPATGRSDSDVPYVLHVGTIEPRKNLRTLLRAFLRLTTETNLPHRLIVAGAEGWGNERLSELAGTLGIADRIILPGRVDDADLPQLFANAAAFVLPSLYEGFGLPILEAMASGTPVLCSDRAALHEIAGSAALLFDPADHTSISEGLIHVLTDADTREDLRRKGLEHAANFSWEKCASETMDVYRELC